MECTQFSLEGKSTAAEQFPEIVHKVEMVSTLMNNYTIVMKQHCTTNCSHIKLYILEKHLPKQV